MNTLLLPLFATILISLFFPEGAGFLGMGLAFGLKHALDADHLAAVSTIVSEKSSLRSSSIVGAVWGLGHTASLLFMAALVIHLGIQIPARLAEGLELLVAIMLVGLGVNALWSVLRGKRIHLHPHSHSNLDSPHVHLHAHDHGSEHAGGHQHHAIRFLTVPQRLAKSLKGRLRSFFVGMIHGLAGSAALMLVVLATIPSTAVQYAYVILFGIGSIGGMMGMTTLMGIPLVLSAQRSGRLARGIQAAAGVLSLAIGVLLAWRLLSGDALLPG